MTQTKGAASAAVWVSDFPCIQDCGRVHEVDVPLLLFTEEAEAKVVAMMKEMGNYEWLAYLIGTEEQDGSTVVTDLYVPEQTVTPASVESVSAYPADAVGVIHSHGGGTAFWSGTDDAHVNMNNPISVVVGRDKGRFVYKGVRQVPVPCGYYVPADMPIFFESALRTEKLVDDAQEWVQESVSRVTRGFVAITKTTTESTTASQIIGIKSNNVGGYSDKKKDDGMERCWGCNEWWYDDDLSEAGLCPGCHKVFWAE